MIHFSIYRYNPENTDQKPYFQKYEIDPSQTPVVMLLDAILEIRKHDPSLALRRSCREGVCGSDGMNINGKNGLACITNIQDLLDAGFGTEKNPITLKPFTGMP